MGLCPKHVSYHCFLCVLLANGLPHSLEGEREGSCQGFNVFIILHPAWLTLLKCLRFCNTAWLAAREIKEHSLHFFVFHLANRVRYFFQQPSSNRCEIQRQRERAFQKDCGQAQGGFKFSAFVMGEQSSPCPKAAPLQSWEKESGEKGSFVLLCPLQCQVQNLVSRGIRMPCHQA